MIADEYPVEVVDEDGFPQQRFKDPRVREMVLALIDVGKMTPIEIAEALDGRVSPRTIYRWSKGETCPQNERDLKALEILYNDRCK